MKDFSSLGQFASHLTRLAAIGEEVSHGVVKSGAKAIQKDAKARIGHYQDGLGGFPAWEKLAESTVQDRVSKGFTPNDPLLRTGSMRDGIKAEAEGLHAVVGTTDPIAEYQELGTPTIPPRPFLGPAGFASKDAIGLLGARTLVGWVGGVSWKKPPSIS